MIQNHLGWYNTNNNLLCSRAACQDFLRYYGLQNGDECHCGDNDSDFLPADQYQCNMPCSGNCDETCGGSWRMNVYKIKQEPTWTEWDDWECCSVACGNGTMSRHRKCLDEYGNEAKECNGISKETINCIQWTESCDESWKVNVYKIPQSRFLNWEPVFRRLYSAI